MTNTNEKNKKDYKNTVARLNNLEKKSRKKSRILGFVFGVIFCVTLFVLICWFVFKLFLAKNNGVAYVNNTSQMNKDIHLDLSSVGINTPYTLMGKSEKRVQEDIISKIDYYIVIQNTNPNLIEYSLPNIVNNQVTLEPIESNETDETSKTVDVESTEASEGSNEEIVIENKYKDVEYVPDKDSYALPNFVAMSIRNFISRIYKDNLNAQDKIVNTFTESSMLKDTYCDFVFKFTDEDGKLDKACKDIALIWSTESSRGAISGFDKVRNEFIFGGDKRGYEVKADELKKKILDAIQNGELHTKIDAPYNSILPTGESFKDQYRIVSSFTTETSNNPIRNTNIDLACKAINGTILKPGEEFSFNNTVGERREEKGYGLAPAYVEGEVVEELGGGVCQVSSTLYNAVICAGLKTTYRTSHTFEPSYVAPGLDATVSWRGADYKFVNNSNHQIGIRTYYSNFLCKAEIFAVPILENGVTISVSSTKLQDLDTPAPVVIPDTENESKGTKGSEWQVFKIKKINGKTVEKEHDHYSKYKGHTPRLHESSYEKYMSSSEAESIKESIRESARVEQSKATNETKKKTPKTTPAPKTPKVQPAPQVPVVPPMPVVPFQNNFGSGNGGFFAPF